MKWFYLIASREEGDDLSSLSQTEDGAWEKFCYPSLRREAYDCVGSEFRCKRVSARYLLKIHGITNADAK